MDSSIQSEHCEPPILAPVLTVGVSQVPGALACLSKGLVAYVSGHCISTCSVDSSSQSHISEPLSSIKRITAMAASQDREWLAVAESISSFDPPRIAILRGAGSSKGSLLERYTPSSWAGSTALLTAPDCNTINHISFSADSTTIIASCYDDNEGVDAPEGVAVGDKSLSTRILTWEWKSDHGHEPSGSFEVQGRVIHVTIHPKYSTNVFTMTSSELLLWRRGSAGFRRQDIEGAPALLLNGAKDPGAFSTPQVTFVDYAWLTDGRLAVATSNRRIAVIDGTTVTEVHEIGRAINCLLGLHDNMILVSLAKGGLACYLADKEGGKMEVLSVLNVPESAMNSGTSDRGVTHMSPSYSSLAALGGLSVGSMRRRRTSSNLGTGLLVDKSREMVVETVACYVHHGPVLILDVSLALGASPGKDESNEMFEEVLPSTHTGPVSSISCASNRPLLATCSSSDVTVRVWEYSPLRQVLTHNCHHAPLAVGIDPWGRELVVCYVDCSRCYSIVEGSLLEVAQMMCESPHGPVEMMKCSMVKYNPTGHLIAIVGGDKCKDVVIFSTLYHKALAALHGHFTTIVDIAWSADGLLLTTVSENEVFTWHMETYQKVQSHNLKTFNNSAVTCSLSFDSLIVGDGGQGLKVLATNRNPLIASSGSMPATGEGGGVAVASKKELNARPSIVWSEGVDSSDPSFVNKSEMVGDSQPFVVPGKAHMARLASAEKKATASTSSLSIQIEKSPRKIDSRALPPQAPPPASLSFPPSDLIPTCLLPTSLNPAKACLALLEHPGSGPQDKGWKALVGSQSLGQGRARVCHLPSPPTQLVPGEPPVDIYDVLHQEYALHSSEITSMVSHPNGRILFSADNSGIWKLHILLPPPATLATLSPSQSPLSLSSPSSRTPLGAGGGRSPTSKSLKRAASTKNLALAAQALSNRPRAVLPPFSEISAQCSKAVGQLMPKERDLSSDFVSVRSSDLRLLKENTRELKDKLAKQAHQAEFLVYQKEQEVRRDLEGELHKWRREAEEASTMLLAVRNQLQESKLAHDAAETSMRLSLTEAVEEERDVFMSKLSQEVERTNEAEKEVDKMRVKFGKRLWEVEEERAANVKASQAHAVELEAQAVETRKKAEAEISKARGRMEIESTIDMEWNEEDISRVTDYTSAALTAERQKLEELLAKHTLQTGLYHKTLQDNLELKESNEALKAEQQDLNHQVLGLSEELDAMHVAWMERDGRQRAMDSDLKELMSRMQQANVFTALANSRIAELNNELEPVKAAKAEAQEMVAKLENLQVRQAERRLAQTQELQELKARYDRLREEDTTKRRKMEVREEYFANFTTQLFRLVSSVDHHQWPVVFGKLYKDYQAGKDLANWSRYLPDHSGTTSGAALKKQAGQNQSYQIVLPSAAAAAAASPSPLAVEPSSAALSPTEREPPQASTTSSTSAPPKTNELEFQEQMKELQAQVKHLERLLTSAKESRNKSESSQKVVIHRLVQENSSILEEANVLKRELRGAKEGAEKLGVEVRMLQSQLALLQANGGGGGGGAVGGNGGRLPWRSPPSASASASAILPTNSLPSHQHTPHRLAASGLRRPSDPEAYLHESPSSSSSLLQRELSSSELIAAAAANNSAASNASLYDPSLVSRPGSSGSMFGGGGGGGGGMGMSPRNERPSSSHHSSGQGQGQGQGVGGSGSSRIPQAIPEDSPLHTTPMMDPSSSTTPGTGTGAGAGREGVWSRPASSTVRPGSSSTVTGEMPSGGWWLGEGSPFEVPASLSTILKGGNPASPGSSSVLLPSSSKPGSRVGGSRPGSRAGQPNQATSPAGAGAGAAAAGGGGGVVVSTQIAAGLMPRTPSLSRNQSQPLVARPGTSASSSLIGPHQPSSNDALSPESSHISTSGGPGGGAREGHGQGSEVPASVALMGALSSSMRGGTAPAQMATYHSGPGVFVGIKRGATPTAGSITSRPNYYPPGSAANSNGPPQVNPYQSSGHAARGAGSRGGARGSGGRPGVPRSLEVGGSGLGFTSPQPSPSAAAKNTPTGSSAEIDGHEEGEGEGEGAEDEVSVEERYGVKPPRINVLPKAFFDNLLVKSPAAGGKSPSSPNVRMASLGAGFRSFQPRQKDY